MKNYAPRHVCVAEVSIIIPVKDEEDGLRYLIDDLASSGLQDLYSTEFIFVIDGRTSDDSREIASRFSTKIIDQKDTHGKGSAVRQAFDYWKEVKTPFVVMLDADGSYSFQGVISVIEELKKGTEVVSGSRFLGKKESPPGMTKTHNIGNRILSKVSSIRNSRKITDLCTGLWGFRANALDKIKIKSRGFDLEAELSGEVRKRLLTHLEIPIGWSQRKGGSANFDHWDGLPFEHEFLLRKVPSLTLHLGL